jgi:hypothetical protein
MTGGTQRPPWKVEIEGLTSRDGAGWAYCGIVMDKASESPVSK